MGQCETSVIAASPTEKQTSAKRQRARTVSPEKNNALPNIFSVCHHQEGPLAHLLCSEPNLFSLVPIQTAKSSRTRVPQQK